jgi:hypothetical protein
MTDKEIITVIISAIAVLLVCSGLLIAFGERHENERLYNKCLNKNSEMIYIKAVEHCKEEVK